MELEHILVTGASWFMGKHLVSILHARWVQYIHFSGDLLDTVSIQDFFQKQKGITQIVHLVWTFDGELDRQIELNFTTTKNLLEVAHTYGITQIIFASSGAVYGEPLRSESDEGDPPLPNTHYGLSKVFAEEILSYYSRNYWFRSVILRFPNVYGKNSRWVIASFLKSLSEEGKITLYGDGEQSRNFLHVSDAVEAIYLSLSYRKSEIFNITNPIQTSLNQLISILKDRFEFDVEYLPKNNNLRDLLLSGEKAKRLLGFEAKQKEILLDF